MAEQKNIVVAYLLWFLFGGWGIHRLYLGDTQGAGINIALYFGSILLWWVAGLGVILYICLIVRVWLDLCLIPTLVEKANNGQQQVVVVQTTVQGQPQYVQQQPQYVQQHPQYQQQQPQYVQQQQQYAPQNPQYAPQQPVQQPQQVQEQPQLQEQPIYQDQTQGVQTTQ